MALIISGLITVALIIFWIVQFKQLMNMETAEFKDKNDKLIWALVLITMNLFGAFLFYFIAPVKRDLLLPENKPEFTDEDYHQALEKYPEHETSISEALELPLNRRIPIERRFKNFSKNKLNREYKNGKYNMSKAAFGVLITIMNSRKIFEA